MAEVRVTAVVPTHPARGRPGDSSTPLGRALVSVGAQTERCVASVALDTRREGAAPTRNRALDGATTPWVAFLDSDDEWMPHHVATLLAAAEETGADVVYPWPEMHGGGDPAPDRFGLPFDAEELRRRSYIPVTSLARTELAQQARFGPYGDSPYDDHGFYLRMLDLGARFHHVPERTWVWNVVPGVNTSGLPDRGDAAR